MGIDASEARVAAGAQVGRDLESKGLGALVSYCMRAQGDLRIDNGMCTGPGAGETHASE